MKTKKFYQGPSIKVIEIDQTDIIADSPILPVNPNPEDEGNAD